MTPSCCRAPDVRSTITPITLTPAFKGRTQPSHSHTDTTMKTQAMVSLVFLTASVRLNSAEADKDEKDKTEAQEFRTTLERGSYYRYRPEDYGRQDEDDSDSSYRSGEGSKTMTEAMPAQSLREIFTTKDAMKSLLNNITLWIIFLLTDYWFQFI